MKRKYVKTLRGVRIPTWALCYLVNSDDSGLDAEDRETVDAWVERTRNGGRIDVCPLPVGEPYFTPHPAFGLACDVEDCDVVVDMSPARRRRIKHWKHKESRHGKGDRDTG